MPYIGKASSPFSRSIHGPGRGRRASSRGVRLTSTNGRASPSPSIRNTTSAIGHGIRSAAPSAKAMKGAVQGAATTTASMPVKKAPAAPGSRASGPEPAACRPAPMWKTPERFSATASISSDSPAMTAGDCSWKPQPTASPPALRASSRPARPRKVVSTPARKASPSRRARAGSCAAALRAAAFMARIGNTHGIRLRIRPPSRANSAAWRKPIHPIAAGAVPASASAMGARSPEPRAPGRSAPGSARISKAPREVASTPSSGPVSPPRAFAPAPSARVRPSGPQAPVCGAA